MSDIVDQPPPIATNHTPAWELVIQYVEQVKLLVNATAPGAPSGKAFDAMLTDMRERDKLGRERYGKPLTAHNGRRQLVDAYQEALDKLVYLRAWLDENGVDINSMSSEQMQAPSNPGEIVASTFCVEIASALQLRMLIADGL